jgi:hypothetical protein
MASPPGQVADPDSHERAVLRAALQRYYPQLVRGGAGGVSTVLFVTTTTGRVERTDLMRGLPPEGPAADALFRRFADLRAERAHAVTGVTRFEPGEVGPDPIVVIWAEREVPGSPVGPIRLSRPNAIAGQNASSGQR